MNILITTIVTPNSPNGLLRYIQGLIEYLQQLDSRNKYYILINEELNEHINVTHKNFKKINIGIPYYPRILMRPVYFLWQNFFLKKIIKKYKIDLFHSPNPIPLFITGGKPFVVTIHDVAEFSEKRHSFFKQWFRRYLATRSAHIASAIITVSDFSKSEIVKYLKIDSDKVYVTPLGLSINSTQALKMKFEKPFFLHVSGTKKNKNIDNIIDAFNMLNQNKIQLIFVGGINNRIKEKNILILKKKGIYFKGYVSDDELKEYYRNAYALVYPSLYEGYGLPIIEAMSFGVPVITSNVTSMPEVAGDAALFVDPRNIESINEAMKVLIKDEDVKLDLIGKGFRRQEKFIWRDTATKTINVYDFLGDN